MMKNMKTYENTLDHSVTKHLTEFFTRPEEVLFFDIETTGFSPKSASIYLIGCAFYASDGWHIRQYFTENAGEETQLLRAFTSFAATFSRFVHFNGLTFDVPFIAAKCKKHALRPFEPADQLDIYKCISPYKNLLHLPGCRQKQIEEFVGLHREDKFNGGQLIELYRIYTEEKSPELLHVLMLHNYEDISGMLQAFSIMAFPKLFEEGAFIVEDVSLDGVGSTSAELLIRLALSCTIPVPAALHSAADTISRCFLTCRDRSALIKVPVYEGTLKYFFADYKNYAYLPAEDQAIHKSVAVYVDKSQRMPATAATCYTKKTGKFVPWFGPADKTSPVFYEQHKAPQGFKELTEEFLSNQEEVHNYVMELLGALKTVPKSSHKTTKAK